MASTGHGECDKVIGAIEVKQESRRKAEGSERQGSGRTPTAALRAVISRCDFGGTEMLELGRGGGSVSPLNCSL